MSRKLRMSLCTYTTFFHSQFSPEWDIQYTIWIYVDASFHKGSTVNINTSYFCCTFHGVRQICGGLFQLSQYPYRIFYCLKLILLPHLLFFPFYFWHVYTIKVKFPKKIQKLWLRMFLWENPHEKISLYLQIRDYFFRWLLLLLLPSTKVECGEWSES